MPEDHDEHQPPVDDAEMAHLEALRRTVLRKSLRRERARLRRTESVWSWLATFGLVGWTVIVPTVSGLALGRFLDDRIRGRVNFTITLLVVGAAIGLWMAWHWVRTESHHHE